LNPPNQAEVAAYKDLVTAVIAGLVLLIPAVTAMILALRGNTKAIAAAAIEAKGTAEKIAEHTEIIKVNLEEAGSKQDQTAALVRKIDRRTNGAVTSLLRSNAALAKRVAALTKDPKDEIVAESAEKRANSAETIETTIKDTP